MITGEQKRLRCTPEEKARFVALAMQPGYTVSLVARQYGIMILPVLCGHGPKRGSGFQTVSD
ncbi:transposase [Pantoea sp. EEL5]|uniref:transposase n=1 Tax=Pantoea sp. EEL5 TaxID=3416806 RepID=UPI003CED1FCF